MLRTRLEIWLCLNICADTSLGLVFWDRVKLGDIVSACPGFVNPILCFCRLL